MKASECTFDKMMIVAAAAPMLAEAASYIQVEYGLEELQACWDGFVHTSDYYNQEFKSRKQICAEFTYALTEYIHYLGESSHLQVGSKIPSDS
jgi:hypothetical protein